MDKPHPKPQLPIELLVKIFKSAAAPIPYRVRDAANPGYFQRLHTLAQVCRFWARVVKDSPELWWLVDGQDPPSESTIALRRSKNYPIVFEYRIRPAQVPFNPEVWSAVCQHMHRWKTADLGFDFVQADNLSSIALLESPAPILEKIYMRSTPRSTRPINLNLFNGCAPKLSRLVMSNVVLRDWSSPILNGLKSFSFEYIGRSGPSLQQMLDVLRASPLLDRFELEYVNFSGDAAALQPAIALLELNSIHLGGLPSAVTTHILKAIDAPNCAITWVHVADEEGFDNEIYDVATSWATPAIKRSLAAGGHLDMNIITRRDATFCFHQPDGHSSDHDSATFLYLPDIPTRPSILDWGLALIDSRGSAPTSLTVSLLIEDMTVEEASDTLSMLRRLPSITNLEMMGCDHDAVTTILKHLTFPSLFAVKGASPWLCPDLRVLSFTANIEEEVLMDMVRQRTPAAVLRETAGSGNGAVRLHELSVYGEVEMNARIFRNIRSIVGRRTSCRWVSGNGSEVECPEEEEDEEDEESGDDSDDEDEDSGCSRNGSNDGDVDEAERDVLAGSSSNLASES